MKKQIILVLVLAISYAIGSLTACGGGGIVAAPTLKGERIPVAVFLDLPLEGKFDQEVAELVDLGTWMANDCKNSLNVSGYRGIVSDSEDASGLEFGQYLLKIRVVEFVAGRHTKKAVAGLGEGHVSVEVEFELFGKGGSRVYHGRKGKTTPDKWQKAAGEIDAFILEAVSERINELH